MAEGFPQLIWPTGSYRLRRTALAAIAVLGFISGIAATTAAVEGHPDAGVIIGSDNHVESVSPTGFAWRDGIRPGQLVLSRSDSDAETGWELVVAGPGGAIATRETPVLEALRNSLPFALASLAAGCLAIAFLRINRSWALPCACLSLASATAPLLLANHASTATVMALSAAVPGFWLARRLERYRLVAVAVAVGSVVLLALWYMAFEEGAAADGLEPARRILALGGTGALIADRAMQRRPARLSPLQALWIGGAAAVVVGGLALVYFAGFPAPLIAVAIVLALLASQPLRGAVGRRVELALMSDLRQQVAADVAEEERGRLARELHDSPLQELSAVIRRLELVPEASSETASLLAIADQLRGVAIDLRPPMLDDIGLAAALDFLAEQVTTPGTVVTASLSDLCGLDQESRPPSAVEFSVYRIVREAVANALGHANAHLVTIKGSIAPNSVDLTVLDDGIGIQATAQTDASGRGRLGLASMRRRAQAIGAELVIARPTSEQGTRVSISWRA